jgi:uncharacterized protein
MKTTLYILSFCSLLLLECGNRIEGQNTNWVFDQENILTDSEEEALNEMISQFEQETFNEIAIVTTPDIGEHDKMVFYAVEFGNRLGVGKKDQDNGLIIVFSSTLRETFIATGLETEKVLTDPICKTIIDDKMIPQFSDGNYYQGIENGLKECIRIWKEKE